MPVIRCAIVHACLAHWLRGAWRLRPTPRRPKPEDQDLTTLRRLGTDAAHACGVLDVRLRTAQRVYGVVQLKSDAVSGRPVKRYPCRPSGSSTRTSVALPRR